MMRPRAWLAPAGAAYLALSRAWHLAWDRGWRTPSRARVPVVSVGNLLAGGTGKTPTVAWLADRLAGPQRPVGIVSRGYGGVRGADPLLVSLGGTLLAPAAETGDEPALLAATTRAAVVAVGRRRADAARLAVENGARLLLLDDGFQHRALARDVDIVLLDAERPFGNGRGIPAGLLREPVSALARADVVLLTRATPALLAHDGPLPPEACPAPLRQALGRSSPPVFAAEHVPDALTLPDGRRDAPHWVAGRAVLAVSGIARPESFEATLATLGARLAGHEVFPDHHAFTREEVERAGERAAALGAETIVTTAKDAVRWPRSAPRPAVLSVALRVPAEAALLAAVESRLPRTAGDPA